jgi:hypothetical protein
LTHFCPQRIKDNLNNPLCRNTIASFLLIPSLNIAKPGQKLKELCPLKEMKIQMGIFNPVRVRLFTKKCPIHTRIPNRIDLWGNKM